MLDINYATSTNIKFTIKSNEHSFLNKPSLTFIFFHCVPVYSVLDADDVVDSFSQLSPSWFTEGQGNNWLSAVSGLRINTHKHTVLNTALFI